MADNKPVVANNPAMSQPAMAQPAMAQPAMQPVMHPVAAQPYAGQPPPQGYYQTPPQGYQQPPVAGYAPQPQYQTPPPQQYGQPAVPVYAGQAPVVVGQPGVQVQLPSRWPRQSMRLVCPHCRHDISTRTELTNGTGVWLGAAVLCWLTGLLCVWVPFVVDDAKDCTHYCPNCKNMLGVNKPI